MRSVGLMGFLLACVADRCSWTGARPKAGILPNLHIREPLRFSGCQAGAETTGGDEAQIGAAPAAGGQLGRRHGRGRPLPIRAGRAERAGRVDHAPSVVYGQDLLRPRWVTRARGRRQQVSICRLFAPLVGGKRSSSTAGGPRQMQIFSRAPDFRGVLRHVSCRAATQQAPPPV
jgi:hypothetical protein